MRDGLFRVMVLHWNCTTDKLRKHGDSESMSINDIMCIYDMVKAGNIYLCTNFDCEANTNMVT